MQHQVLESPFATAVRLELEKARERHKPMASLHEAYAVVLEEFEEFWEETKKRPDKRDRYEISKELVQIAAMAQRTAEDLGYLQYTGGLA